MDAVATHVVFLRDVLAADRAHAFERERENGQRCQISCAHANFSKLNFSVVVTGLCALHAGVSPRDRWLCVLP